MTAWLLRTHEEGGSMTPDELKRVDQLEKQQALQTQAIRALLEGRLDGPGSAKGFLLALDSTLEVTPANFEFGQ